MDYNIKGYAEGTNASGWNEVWYLDVYPMLVVGIQQL